MDMEISLQETGVVFVGIDDTDDHNHPMGTGKLARLLALSLEREYHWLRCRGVVRHQLFVDPRIPYTSHNSPACIILDLSSGEEAGKDVIDLIKKTAIPFILHNSSSAADPGLCIVSARQVTTRVINFGISAGNEVLSKKEAIKLAEEEGIMLLELGGTGDGIIGALSAGALTGYGYAGRFLEYKGVLRDLPEKITGKELLEIGIKVISTGREAEPVHSVDMIYTEGWLRPRLIGGEPVVFVQKKDGKWLCFDKGGKSANKEVKKG